MDIIPYRKHETEFAPIDLPERQNSDKEDYTEKRLTELNLITDYYQD